jgi:hypothetical protein
MSHRRDFIRAITFSLVMLAVATSSLSAAERLSGGLSIVPAGKLPPEASHPGQAMDLYRADFGDFGSSTRAGLL